MEGFSHILTCSSQSTTQALILLCLYIYIIIIIILFYSGCYNKLLEIGWLRQQEFISHNSGGWKSKIKVLANSFLGESPRWPFSRYVFPWQREDALVSLPFLIRTLVGLSCPHLNLITSQRPHLPIPSHWGVSTSTYAFQGVRNIQSITHIITVQDVKGYV